MTLLTELVVAPLPDGRRWYLKAPLIWYGAIDGRSWRVEVPKGAITDFASIPRLIWFFISPWGKHGRAAVLHDFLYRSRKVTRREADLVFRVVMAECGVLLLVRWSMWSAVRLFGWIAWNGNQHDDERGVPLFVAEGEIAPDAVAPKRGLDRVFSVLCRLFCGRTA